MRTAFALTLFAAGAANASAQLLLIPPSGTSVAQRIAFDDWAESPVLVLPDADDAQESDVAIPFLKLPRTTRIADYDEIKQPAEFAWAPEVPERDWQYIVIHHSATSGGSVESIHSEHRRRRDTHGRQWLGIGYHFVIGNGSGMAEGEISPTFRWREQIHGAHSGSIRHNGSGIGICLIGNFEDSEPTPAQRDAVIRVVGALAKEYDIPSDRIIGHRQIRATACPGRYFPLEQVVQESLGQDIPRALRR